MWEGSDGLSVLWNVNPAILANRLRSLYISNMGMKKICLLAGLLLGMATLENVQAQSLKQDSLFVPDQLRQFQFQLEEEVEKIEDLRYDKTGEPIKGTLSPDKKRVVMDNYKKGQRVKFSVTYPDGRSEELTKSPCYIDPVTWEL